MARLQELLADDDSLGAAEVLDDSEGDSDELAPGMHDSDADIEADSDAPIEADSDELGDSEPLIDSEAPIDSDALADSDALIDSDSDAIALGEAHADELGLSLGLVTGVDVAPATVADGVAPELEQAAATRTTASNPPIALKRRVMGIPLCACGLLGSPMVAGGTEPEPCAGAGRCQRDIAPAKVQVH